MATKRKEGAALDAAVFARAEKNAGCAGGGGGGGDHSSAYYRRKADPRFALAWIDALSAGRPDAEPEG